MSPADATDRRILIVNQSWRATAHGARYAKYERLDGRDDECHERTSVN